MPANVNSRFGRNIIQSIHIVKPTANGIEKLSSTYLEEIFSIIAPTNAATKPIMYSSQKYPTFGVNNITMLELIKKAKVPSKLL